MITEAGCPVFVKGFMRTLMHTNIKETSALLPERASNAEKSFHVERHHDEINFSMPMHSLDETMNTYTCLLYYPLPAQWAHNVIITSYITSQRRFDELKALSIRHVSDGCLYIITTKFWETSHGSLFGSIIQIQKTKKRIHRHFETSAWNSRQIRQHRTVNLVSQLYNFPLIVSNPNNVYSLWVRTT